MRFTNALSFRVREGNKDVQTEGEKLLVEMCVEMLFLCAIGSMSCRQIAQAYKVSVALPPW